MLRDSGVPAIGALPWGSHLCQFYRSGADLGDVLVPYFLSGLRSNEQCLWVTCAPLRAEDARAQLRAALPDLPALEARGQIEILDHGTWYEQAREWDSSTPLDAWIKREQRALSSGYDGVRLTGNAYWLERDDWRSFIDYEAIVNEGFQQRRILALCSYCTSRCDSEDVLDVLRSHQFALVRREGAWDLIEGSSLRIAKQELQRLNGELEQRVLDRTAELEAALRARDELISVASHDLRTPIAALKLFVEGLLRGSQRGGLTAAQTEERLVKAREECRRLERLVGNLLDVSRASSGALRLQLEEVDLAEVTRSILDLHAEELRRAGVAIDARIPPSLTGRWDRMRLEQVVSNLLSNAAWHAPGAPLEVTVTEEAGRALLQVRDHGPGIPHADQPRIFERFVQGAAAHPRGGMGLGLWIVRHIVEALGGAIDLSSSPGEGSTFTVTLPRSGPTAD